jgi:1,2-diacylglycerol 3-beta-galactosyltransferase
MKRIEFVFFDAGGGHRSAATALQLAIKSRQVAWDVNLMNLQEELDKLDILRRLTGIRIQDAYNSMLRSGWTLGSAQILLVLQATIWAHHTLLVKLMVKYWQSVSPDMVVSFVPHFNRVMGESFEIAFPGRPFVTVLTDLANYPPNFWMERREQYFICGTDLAEQQALQFTGASERVFRVSGMILHPRYYEPQTADRAAARTSLGLGANFATGLVLFGGFGSSAIEKIVDRLEEADLPVQLILICGRNEQVRARLAARCTRMPIFVEGFTTNIPYYMHLADRQARSGKRQRSHRHAIASDRGVQCVDAATRAVQRHLGDGKTSGNRRGEFSGDRSRGRAVAARRYAGEISRERRLAEPSGLRDSRSSGANPRAQRRGVSRAGAGGSMRLARVAPPRAFARERCFVRRTPE